MLINCGLECGESREIVTSEVLKVTLENDFWDTVEEAETLSVTVTYKNSDILVIYPEVKASDALALAKKVNKVS